MRLLEPALRASTAVADGQAALEAALAEPPDLVVSDVMMPRLDGMAAAGRAARPTRAPRASRSLLLSARAGQEAAVEGLAAGADDYLVKPFSAQELLARVGAHLHLGRARREAEERFTAMADLAPALIWVADAAGRRVFVNRGWTAVHRPAVRDELGDGWRSALHPEDRDRYLETVAAATADSRGWEVEFRLRRADGAYHWLLERAVPDRRRRGLRRATSAAAPTSTPGTGRPSGRRLLAAVGAALDRETDVDRAARRPRPAARRHAGWPTCAPSAWSATTARLRVVGVGRPGRRDRGGARGHDPGARASAPSVVADRRGRRAVARRSPSRPASRRRPAGRPAGRALARWRCR